MSKIIKITHSGGPTFDMQTGKKIQKAVTDYASSCCRELVEPNAKFCWRCGEKLSEGEELEYYLQGRQVTEEKFNKAMKEE